MAAADAMVHATAGLTVLEAHIRGCPVVSYGFSAGHLRANNAAFERFGLAEVARSEHELESVLRHVTRERRSPDSSFASLPSIASRALTVRPRVKPAAGLAAAHGAGRDRRRLAAIAVVMFFTVIDREAPYKVIAKPLEGRIHLGKDNDDARRRPSRGAKPSRRASRPAQAAAASRPLIAALLRRRRPRRPRSSTPAPPWRRSCRGLGGARDRAARRTGRGRVALTFDDGPHPQGTPAVLEILREAARRRPSSSPASRSCGGRRWSPRSSPPGTGSSCTATATATCCGSARARLLDDAERARAAIEEATGQAVADYRPPYGIFSAAACARSAAAAGGRCSGRAGDGTGTRRATAESIARRASAGVVAGDILLLHDADYYSARGSWVRTAAALPLILEELEAAG